METDEQRRTREASEKRAQDPTPATIPASNSGQGGGQNQDTAQGSGSNQTTAPPPAGTGTTNPLMPTFEELGSVTIASNSIATEQTVKNILAMVQAQHQGSGVKDIIALAVACYHNGASKYVTLEGTSPGGAPFSSLKDVVEQHCTLRQFCSYYAKYCYILGRKTKTPPANWTRRGFKEEAKYAAFDFFYAVLSDAAPSPPGGMAFQPTQAEILGHSLNAKFAIVESRQQENQHSNRGNLAAMQQVGAPVAPPLITFPS